MNSNWFKLVMKMTKVEYGKNLLLKGVPIIFNYPQREIFTHIDYTKNQYSADEYQQKYADSIDGMPIDRYTSCRDWHYKIWCIENGEFSKETWYKLMIVSLPRIYQNLLNEILN